MKNASKNVPILDGAKFNWYNGTVTCDGLGLVVDHPALGNGGRPPAKVGVRSHRTGWTVVFDFVETADDGEMVTLNYQGVLPDGRYCALSLATG